MSALEPAQFVVKYFPEAKFFGKEAMIVCPECKGGDKGEKCFSINTVTGTYICNRQNNCAIKGSFHELKKLIGIDRKAQSTKAATAKSPKVFKKPTQTVDPMRAKGKVQSYLESRGLDFDLAKAWGVSQKSDVFFPKSQAKHNAVVFPICSEFGEVLNFKYCALGVKDFSLEAGCSRPLIGMNHVPPDELSLLITEGQWDMLAARQLLCEFAVSVPNGSGDCDWIDICWEWLERFESIYLCFDMDEAGRKLVETVSKRLGLYRCHDLQLPAKDLNDYLQKGGESEAFWELLVTAKETKPEVLTCVTSLKERVRALLSDDEATEGHTTGFPWLDSRLGGWRTGEVTVITGVNGSGKSNWIAMAMNQLMARGQRVCIASLEIMAEKYLLWIVRQFRSLRKSSSDPTKVLTANRAAQVIDEIGHRLWFVDHVKSIDLDELLDIWTYTNRRHDVRFFVLDSRLMLKVRRDDLDAEREMIDKISDFATVYKSHVFFVVHPRKVEGKFARKEDVGGSGAITDRAQNVIAISRDPKIQYRSTLGLLKNRDHGDEGQVNLMFCPETKAICEESTDFPDFEKIEKRYLASQEMEADDHVHV
jgi:twinkle protein